MFLVGELKDQAMAHEIAGDLLKAGIEIKILPSDDQETYQIWVLNEPELSLAQEHFRVKMGFSKPLEIEPEWIKIKTIPRGELTYVILLVCVGIYLLSFTNLGRLLYPSMMIGKIDSGLFYEVKRGQLWRLFTPCLLHLSFLHILFNMLWFKDLGYLMEFNFNKKFFSAFMLFSGLFSNILQYFVNGPEFGGMSGVLYAMLGFIWAYKAINPDFSYSLPKRDVGMMIIWYFLCLTGIFGPIANTAHGMGLVAGLLWAQIGPRQWNLTRLKFLFIALFFFIFTLFVEGLKLKGNFYILINGL